MNNYNYPYQSGYPNGNGNYGTSNEMPVIIPSQSSSAPGVGGNEITNEYAEELLNKNIGKTLKVYMSFNDSIEWRDKVFEGILEAWGRDFFLLKDLNSNKRYMLWNIYINYLEFNEDVTL